MAHYIDKDALVAEIERRIKKIDEIGTYLSPKGVLTNLLCHLNTLEVKEGDIISKEEKSKLMRKCVQKAYQRGYRTGVMITTNEITHKQEVDLEKEVEDWVKTGPHTSYPWCTIPDAIRITAEHFFELGLTQKGK